MAEGCKKVGRWMGGLLGGRMGGEGGKGEGVAVIKALTWDKRLDFSGNFS